MQTPPDSRHLYSAGCSVSSLFVLLAFLVLFALHFTESAFAGERQDGTRLKVVRITPAGSEVPAGRQIVIEFDRPVVPLGRMERSASEIPVSATPYLDCRWRWLAPATLACNLDEESSFRPATGYTLTVNPGPLNEDGAGLDKPVRHTFTTELPKVKEAWFSKWLAPRLPETMLRFNLPIAQASLAAHLFYLAPGKGRIAAQVTENRDNGLWQVRPDSELPENVPVELRIEPGLLSLEGPQGGIEDRVIDTLFTIPEFRFLGVECSDADSRNFVIEPGVHQANRTRCLPSGGISLLFSAPVIAEDIAPGLQLSPALTRRHQDADPWEEVYSYSQLAESYSPGKKYSLYLPESILKAFSEYRLQLAEGSVSDQFGRPLAVPVDMAFATDHRAPDFALTKNMPVLEKGLDTDAHVWAVNIDELAVSFEGTGADGTEKTAGRVIRPEGPRDASIPVPLGVREMVGSGSGLVQGHFTTRPEVPGKSPEERWFFAQVTPYHVHAKLGHHGSLVWITDMTGGAPVSGVTVEVVESTFNDFGKGNRKLVQAVTAEDGVAELPGTAVIDPTLTKVWADGWENPGLFLCCRKDGDLAVLPLRYEYQAASEGANREYIPEWLRPLYGHIRAWGTTAQGIYRAGDIIQYKIYVRDQDNLRFARPPGAGNDAAIAVAEAPNIDAGQAGEAAKTASGPVPPRYHLKVEDPTGKIIHERRDIRLSSFGAFHGEVRVPQNGAVGWYHFHLTSSFSKEQWQPLRVLVSDFTPSPFKVTTDLNGRSFETGDTIEVTSEARLHAGGPYTDAAAKVTASLDQRPFSPEIPALAGFQFDSAEREEDDREVDTQTLYEGEGRLDDTGTMVSSFAIAETSVWYGQMMVETAVSDDRGKSIAGRIAVPCFGRDRFVGILQPDWTLRQDTPAALRLVVVGQDGRIVGGVPVTVTSEYQKTWAARVKGAGEDYLTEYEHSWEKEEDLQATSGSEPVELRFTPRHAGRLRLTATIADSGGRTQTTVIERWVLGSGTVMWESTPGNLLDVFPEKSSYSVGETARFLVQNPFPGARALITVERFGVIQRWQKVLPGSSEIIEVPVLPDYLPGFYLSVLVTSPRVEKPPGPQGEDLGKPTWRMGYVKVPVKDPYKELQVTVTPAQEVYRPGDEVKVDLQAALRQPQAVEGSPPIELAVAVLDEAVFDMLREGSRAFDPYAGFYSLDELDLSNYNLLMQLVGREKLALKGASTGGGGGPDLSMRSLFKFVSYWNPALQTDDAGRAGITFKVPDNLTGWRVLAMAVTPEDRMGLGQGTFKVNQKTEIRPALPNQVLAGDRFDAGFTLMNRTDTPRSIKVTIRAEGPVTAPGGSAGAAVTSTQTVTAEPFKRVNLRLPLFAAGPGEIVLTVTAGDATDRDGLRQTLQVRRKDREISAAVYGMTTEPAASLPVVVPTGIREGSGTLVLEMSPSVVGGVDGAFAFLRDYRYSCWEQKLSRGVMAAHYEPLRPYLKGDFAWPDSSKAVEETLAAAVEHQAPNGGMSFYLPEDRHVSPYLSAFTLQAFNWLRQQGYEPPAHVESRLQEYLLNLLRRDAAPEEYSRQMTATVRALALAALAERGGVTAEDVQRFRSHLPSMSLFGRSFYLRAMIATGVPLTEQREVLADILSHGGETGGGMVFQETLDSSYRSLLSSSVRDNAAIMINLLAWLAANPADTSIGGMPVRMMRALTLSRNGRDHWSGTQENLFVVKALADFARLYEDRAPAMQVRGTLDGRPFGMGRFAAFSDPPLAIKRPLAGGDAGRRATLGIEKEGEGRLYYAARLSYVPEQPSTAAVNAGIEVHREYSVRRDGQWQLLQEPMTVATGEVVRVDLFVSLPAERYFVVLDDPVPGGLEPVNRDLATTSEADAAAEESDIPAGSYLERFPDWQDGASGRWSFYHRELRHEAARFYSERLAAGRYHLRYQAQAIAPGQFHLPQTHAEEMYAPDVFGEGTPGLLRIEAEDGIGEKP